MKIYKTVIALVYSNGFYALGNLLLMVCASRYFTTADYGLYRQFFLINDFFVPLLALGLFQAIYYFLSRYTNKAATFIRAVTILLGATVAFGVGLLLFGDELILLAFKSKILVDISYLAIPIILGSLLQSISTAAFVEVDKAHYVAKLNLLYITIYAAGSIGLIFAGGPFFELLIFRAIISPIFFVIVAILGYRLLRSSAIADERIPNVTPTYQDMLIYSVPVGLAGVVGILAQLTDKLIISGYKTSYEYAVYVNGSIEIPLISIVTGALATGALAEMSKLCSEGRYVDAHVLFKRIGEISASFLMPTFVFLWIVAEPLMVLLFGSPYRESSIIFRIYLLLLPIRVVYYGPALIALGKARYILYRGVVELILNVLLSIILINYLGTIGVAVSTVVIIYLWTVPFNLIQISRGFSTSFFSVMPYSDIALKILLSILAGIGPAILYHIYPSDGTAQLAISACIYTILLCALYQFSGVIQLQFLLRRFLRI